MLDGANVLVFLVMPAMIIVIDRWLVYAGVVTQEDGVSVRLLAACTVLAAWIVVSGWLLSMAGLLHPAVWRTLSVAILAAAYVAARLVSVPPHNLLADGASALWHSPVEIKVLAGVTAIWLAFGLVRITLLPTVNGDSLFVHNVVAAVWLQDGTLSDFATWPAVTFYPVNAHLLTMFHLAFAHDNTFIELAQLEAYVVAIAACYALLRTWEVRQAIALGAGVLFGALRIALAISTTNQVDMPTVALFATVAVFLARTFTHKRRPDLWLAGTAFGLYFGARVHGLVVMPALAALLGLWVVAAGGGRRLVGRVIAAFGLPLGVLGMPRYAQNLVRHGTPMAIAEVHANLGVSLATLATNVSTDWPANYLDRPWSLLGNVAYQHNTATFGPLLSFVALPLAVGGLAAIRWRQPRTWFETPLPVLLLGTAFLLGFSASFVDNTPLYHPRQTLAFALSIVCCGAWGLERLITARKTAVLAASMAAFAVLVNASAWLYGHTLRRVAAALLTLTAAAGALAFRRGLLDNRRLRGVALAGFAGVIVAQYVLSAIYDFRASLAVMRLAASLPREQRTSDRVQAAWSDGPWEPGMPTWLEENVPPDAWLALYNESDDSMLAYTTFGPRHTRHVRQLMGWDDTDRPAAAEHRLSGMVGRARKVWLLVPDGSEPAARLLAEQAGQVHEVGQHNGWTLWCISTAGSE